MGDAFRAMKPAELRRHQGVVDFPVRAYIAKRGRKIIGMGGLAWRFGRCDLWLDVRRRELVNSHGVVRLAHRMLRIAAQLGETEVFCLRDDHPNSAKLLRVIGMQHIGDVEVKFQDGTSAVKELYRWQASRQLRQ